MSEFGLKVFFSCSLDNHDKGVVGYFRGICEGMGMVCGNVDRAGSGPPAKVAQKMIRESDAMVAIATKRKKRLNGMYDMPTSVQVEMGMARGLEKPILLFAENEVSVEGLTTGIVAYGRFDRGKLWDNDFLIKVIRSILDLREEVLFRQRDMTVYAAAEYYSDLSDMLFELKKERGSYLWSYAGTRRLVFTKSPKSPIRMSAWASVPLKDIDEKKHIQSEYCIDDASKPFDLVTTTERKNATSIRTSLAIKPIPKPGDYVVLSLKHRSPYLNPIYMGDLAVKTPFVVLNSHNFFAGDGVIITINTKKLKLVFKFPAEYGLAVDCFAPFVGTVVGSAVLHVVKTEIDRMNYNIDSFGGDIIANLEIDNPMLLLQYGLAWNPPERKKK